MPHFSYRQEELGECDEIRIWLSPSLWIIYAVAVCAEMRNLAWSKENPYAFLGLSLAWFAIVVILQILIARDSVRSYNGEPYSLTWFNTPLFAFIICFLVPYFLALHFFHEDGLMNKPRYAMVQAIMPVIVIGNIVYPLPKRVNRAADTAVNLFGFLNAFDIMDVVADYEFIRHYHDGVIALFYISVLVSIILLAFPIGLDEEDRDDPLCGRIWKSLASLIFTDISFCILRGFVMYNEDSLSYGLVFAYKNGISAMINIFLIIRACCSLEW